jgi:hypothetical protein
MYLLSRGGKQVRVPEVTLRAAISHGGIEAGFQYLDPRRPLLKLCSRRPVDASQIGSAQVLIKSYAVAGHFTTRLVIPSIRLSDWAAQ